MNDIQQPAEPVDAGWRKTIGICCSINSLIVIVIAVYFLLLPGLLLMVDLMDPNLREPGGIPRIVWRVHRSLTPRYERWAKDRIASGKAADLNLYDVPSTEWPMFGSVFYLAATEQLQNEWERNRGVSPQAPAVYARQAVDAATDLILDPVHHSWVKTHWGEDYLHRENVFFRAMLIQGLTSRRNLIGDGKGLDVLRDQVESLSAELDRSPYGLLNDYPKECYPIDVFASIAVIRRADRVLGTDHKAFADRAIRAFQGDRLDERGLIAYFADPVTGWREGPSRGIGNSYVSMYAPELYPKQAKLWYDMYERCFWQERMGAAGFREFSKDMPGCDWLYDVDAGPIIDGFSPAGNAFGVAAARVNGRFDHAWTLSAQVLAACWPLPDGSLLGPRILSDAAHAPYLGEAAILFLLSHQPADGVPVITGGFMPVLVYVGFLFYFGLGMLIIAAAVKGLRDRLRGKEHVEIPAVKVQCVFWVVFIAGGCILMAFGCSALGALLVLLAQFLPRARRQKA